MKDFCIEKLTRDKPAKNRLFMLVSCLDSAFVPPISSLTNIKEYTVKLVEKAEVFVAHSVGMDFGFAAVYANDLEHGRAFLSCIGMRPEWQGRGIGSILLEHSINAAKERGMVQMRLEVCLQNLCALQMYKKCGFCEADGPDKNPREGFILLEKVI